MKMLKIFSKPEMFVSDNRLPPGLTKGKAVVNCASADGVIVSDFPPITKEEMKHIHCSHMVEDIFSLRRVNGYGTRSASHLEAILTHNASFVAATRAALTDGIAFSPSSGFHHARYDRPGGYCTFNGLMLAVELVAKDLKVLIIDGDAHWGDGVVDILPKYKNVEYITTSNYRNPEDFIKKAIRAVRRADLVMYQAGADCHEEDLLASGNYSTFEFELRDKYVFESCKINNVPVVWNLAGGYGAPNMKDTIMLHYSTWTTARAVFEQDPRVSDPDQEVLSEDFPAENPQQLEIS